MFVLRSQSVRSYWGVLMRSGAARKDYAELQIHNVVTLATRVRITLLRVLLNVFNVRPLAVNNIPQLFNFLKFF